MKLVIIDDRPWLMKDSIDMIIKKTGVVVETIIYTYVVEKTESEKKMLESLKQDTGINIVEVKIDKYGQSDQFDLVLEEYYKDEDNLFFCDLNLVGEKLKLFFDDRINVKFAKKVMAKEKGCLKRIWFYTTAGESTIEQINNCFPERNIVVSEVTDSNQLILDIVYIEGALRNYQKEK